MQTNRRWVAIAMTALLALTAIAPMAQAGHGHGRKYRRHCATPHVHRVHHAHHARYGHHDHGVHSCGSCGIPVLASFVGGLIIGATVSNAPPPPARYSYYDPYCDLSWTSLDASTPHIRRCDHARYVRVIEVGTGRSVDQWTWHRGSWHNG